MLIVGYELPVEVEDPRKGLVQGGLDAVLRLDDPLDLHELQQVLIPDIYLSHSSHLVTIWWWSDAMSVLGKTDQKVINPESVRWITVEVPPVTKGRLPVPTLN